MDEDGEKKHRTADHVNALQQPAEIHVALNMLNTIESVVHMGRVMHRQNDAGDDLHNKAKRQDAAERP